MRIQSFAAAADQIAEENVNVTGLGCGSGHKEARLLHLLSKRGQKVSCLPCDVSLPLLLTAAQHAQAAFPASPCHPLLCDLSLAADLREILGEAEAARIITFFGLIPNFEPEQILPKLSALTREKDLLLFSANLAPGPDYFMGVQRVLPGYDNPQTRAWLMAFLEDLGAEAGDGAVNFSIEKAGDLLRIAADFRFLRERELIAYDERFVFKPGDVVRLFFSYRHTPLTVRRILNAHHLQVIEQWIAKSEEEGVFLCRKQAGELAKSR